MCCCFNKKSLFHCGGTWFLVCDLVDDMEPREERSLSTLYSSTIFHPTPFVFHLEKESFSLFTSYENMVSLKTLLEVSITEMCVLWLSQHTVSELLSKKENIGHWSYGTRDSMKCYEAQTENLISCKIKTLWNFNISNVVYTWLCIDEQAKCRGLYWHIRYFWMKH